MVEVILFDLGKVILPFNHFEIAEKLSRFSREKAFQDPQRIFIHLFDLQKGIISRFDEGKVSPAEFFQSIKESFHLSLSFEEFVPIWNDIFTEDRDVSDIILSLKGKWKLGLLSNTDPLHFNYILSRFSILLAFEKWILSYEVGFKKPAVEIFLRAIKWASVGPGKILFIDDTKSHVEAAASLGIQGIHFLSAKQLQEELHTRLYHHFEHKRSGLDLTRLMVIMPANQLHA
jgi:FMN phosphatase YigB (HAD superfamily)